MPWHWEPKKDVASCEEKSNEMPLVVASERGRGQTESSNVLRVRTAFSIDKG